MGNLPGSKFFRVVSGIHKLSCQVIISITSLLVITETTNHFWHFYFYCIVSKLGCEKTNLVVKHLAYWPYKMLSRPSMLPSKWESWNFQLHIWKNEVKLHLKLDSNWETLWNKFWVNDQNKIKCIDYSNFLQFQSLFSKILQREFKTVIYVLLVDIQFGMSNVKNADLLSFTPPSKPQWLEIWQKIQEYPKHNLDRK